MRLKSSTSVPLEAKSVPHQHSPQRLAPWVWSVFCIPTHSVDFVFDFSNRHLKKSEKILPKLHLHGKVYG